MAGHEKAQPLHTFETHPSTYKHWKLSLDGAVATLALDIDERQGLRPDDYLLKLNSYDVSVDIELADAVDRLRFEHPEVRTVVVTSAQPRIFCAGANIKMLATSTHGFKVNFCRFTNETRCNLEDATQNSGQVYIAALNGTASGGGYELAEACEKIYLIDDGSSAVSLPEVPLLGVLPGTGGLTRLVDKRNVRRDVADLFCTKAEGFRSRDALKYKLIDGAFPRSKWEAGIAKVAADTAAASPAKSTEGIAWPTLTVEIDEETGSRHYPSVSLDINVENRTARITVKGPTEAAPADAAALREEGSATWALRAWRELDDALLHLRFNQPLIGLVTLHTEGDAANVLAHDAVIHNNASSDWLASEIQLYRARVFRRLDNTAKSFFAIVSEGSCFVGSLVELALAADRSYMLEDEDEAVRIEVTEASDGRYPMSTGLSRLQARFPRSPEAVTAALSEGSAVTAPDAFDLGLVTSAPDDIDWEDEIRIAIEERVSLSPDALTGMEQNLRFVGAETCDTKIFGRLSAWQNWIFQRPNAVGEEGALTLYGHPTRPKFDYNRT